MALALVSRRCSSCKQEKPIGDFYTSRYNKSGYKYECKACCLAYRAAHREYFMEKARERVLTQKLQVLQHYSTQRYPMCACCGITDIYFLTIDHINGGGSKQRKEMPGRRLSEWLIKQGYPDGFQVLCMNCNWSKGQYGMCPHMAMRKDHPWQIVESYSIPTPSLNC